MDRPDASERLAKLTAALATGSDEEAWAALTEALQLAGGGIVASLRKAGWAPRDLDDVMAEALAKVFVARRSVRAIGPYLHRVAHSVAAERWRREQRIHGSERRRSAPLEPPDATFGSSGAPETPAEESDAVRELRAALAEIDAIDHEILFAFASAQDDQDWASEVAARFGLTPNAVRVRKHRAITRLRARLLQEP